MKLKNEDTLIIIFVVLFFVLFLGHIPTFFGIDYREQVGVASYPNNEIGKFCENRYNLNHLSFEDYKLCEENKRIKFEKQYTTNSILEQMANGALILLGIFAVIGFFLIISFVFTKVKK